MKKGIILSVLALLVAAGGVWFWIHRPPVVNDPATGKPSTNGYDYYSAAASQIKDMNEIKDVFGGITASPDVKKSIVKHNAQTLRILRRGFDFKCQSPVMKTFFDDKPGEMANMRYLARLLMIESDTKTSESNWNGAVNCQLDAMRLGADYPHGGVLIHDLVGMAIQTIARQKLWAEVDLLNARDAKTAAARLEIISDHYTDFADIIRGETSVSSDTLKRMCEGKLTSEEDRLTKFKQASIFALPKSTKDQGLRASAVFSKRCIASCAVPFAMKRSILPTPTRTNNPVIRLVESDNESLDATRYLHLKNQANNALLTASLALRAYNYEHKAYPKTLQELVPSYLKKLPMDPFAINAPIRYRPSGAYYVLYSLGPDCRDNGGTPFAAVAGTFINGKMSIPETYAQGDIVAGANTK